METIWTQSLALNISLATQMVVLPQARNGTLRCGHVTLKIDCVLKRD